MIRCKAPEMCSGDDEDLLITAGAVMYDGVIERAPGENGLWVRTEFERSDLSDIRGNLDMSRAQALGMLRFQHILGTLRAWRADFGVLREEWFREWGYGSFVDREDNARIRNVSPATIWYTPQEEIIHFLWLAALASKASRNLKHALMLNGRTGRTSADYYMIYELAELDFKRQPSFLAKKLKISEREFNDVKLSCCNLPPLEGGRHAGQKYGAIYNLKEIQARNSGLLSSWIAHCTRRATNSPRK